MRAGIDTNVWVSCILNPRGRPAAIRRALEQDEFVFVTSQPLLDELTDVLARPRVVSKYGITAADIGQLQALLVAKCEMVHISGTLRLCRDPDDDVVLETAVNGQVDVLVTRDEDMCRDLDLLALLEARGIRVLTVQRFLDELESAQRTS